MMCETVTIKMNFALIFIGAVILVAVQNYCPCVALPLSETGKVKTAANRYDAATNLQNKLLIDTVNYTAAAADNAHEEDQPTEDEDNSKPKEVLKTNDARQLSDKLDDVAAQQQHNFDDDRYLSDEDIRLTIEKLLEAAELQRIRPAETIPELDIASPRTMAQYLLLTGDVNGLEENINKLVDAGLMSEEEAEQYENAVSLEYLTLVENDEVETEPNQWMDLYDEIPEDYVSYDNNDVYRMPVSLEDQLTSLQSDEHSPDAVEQQLEDVVRSRDNIKMRSH